MGTVITGILTDTSLRSESSVEKALFSKADKALPWLGAETQ